ncbi:DNA ligase D [Luteimonas fraxinea]|uniref:DNA ligase (ATP) n=1 Tax=Luteimonas fraxinea TaxID=2901869 RepID=A0ABS8UD66_9GAMM|nr:DNA ligase D [Luteimonas fraxinea]MCD9097446.1 DNA ligase D [Luteimonas fraxinea]MCD9124996.1 DNA ligase D [Luteimonas fraxinea]UHH11702.1 DNA ligase D [Luteimonas fraxinea]
MSLTEYRRKRKFDATREPEPGKPAPRGRRAIFVVQLHHASRRHYDFRLQVGDALKSWAVPKGPSYDPDVKRMAVEVEDHPLDYAEFEGEIPKGQYGGGHVAQFDTGVWAADGDAEAGLAKGHLRFELFGRKLKGRWHLVRSGKPARQPQWLLFKDRDDYAGKLEADDLLADVPAPPAEDAKRAGTGKSRKRKQTEVDVPTQRAHDWAAEARKLPGAQRGPAPTGAFEPQLAKLGDAAPAGEAWLHELKWDGYRLLATVARGQVQLWSRNALEWTGKVPEITEAVSRLGLKSAALDGELIAGRGSREDFNLLQGTLSGERQGALALVLFDLLHVDGVDISEVPLVARKALLQHILGDAPPAHLAFSTHIEGNADTAIELASESGFEGIISKRSDRGYRPGRGDDWRKTKELASDEYAVVGYTPPKGSRSGFGALLLARPDAEHGWRYAGRVGSGFSDALLDELTPRIGRAGRSEPSVYVTPNDTDLRAAKWFAPRFVVEVFSRGTGGHGLLRQPSLKAVRPDKSVDDLHDSDRDGANDMAKTSERSASTAAPAKQKTAKRATKAVSKAAAKSPAKKRTQRDTDSERVPPTLSSPDKVLFPSDALTKRDVADYYAAAMPWLLPEIAGRPLSVIRCPGGIDGPCFFQKHHTAGMSLVETVRLKDEAGASDYLIANDAAAVMELVQFNALEFHPWGAHADAPDTADRIVFDLDPGDGVSWAEIVAAARQVRGLLQQLKLESFVRTTGGKGLHVVVPLDPGSDWDVVKPFAHAFAQGMTELDPLKYVATATKKFRKQKIFVDYLRNGRGATAVASFSLRARAGAPVSMPLRWEDLGKLKSGDAWTLRNAPARLKRLKAHPWGDFMALRQSLDGIVD